MIPPNISASIIFVSSGFSLTLSLIQKWYPTFSLLHSYYKQVTSSAQFPSSSLPPVIQDFVSLLWCICTWELCLCFVLFLPALKPSPPLSPSVSGPSYPNHLVYSAAKYAPFPPAMISFTTLKLTSSSFSIGSCIYFNKLSPFLSFHLLLILSYAAQSSFVWLLL